MAYKTKSYLYLLYLAILPNIFLLITNSLGLVDIYQEYGVETLFYTILYALLSFTFLFTLALICRYLYLFFILLILTTNTIALYYQYNYSISVSYELVQSFFASDTNDILQYFEWTILIYLFIFCIIPTILICKISKLYVFKANIWTPIFLTIILSNIWVGDVILNKIIATNSLMRIMPRSVVIYLIEHFFEQLFDNKLSKENIFIPEKNNHHALKIVLVIGESSRSDHYSLNGYTRNTNPQLAKIKNLVSFTQARSLSSFTLGGVSHITQKYPFHHHYSIVKLMEQNGFKTAWISNQGSRKEGVYYIANEAQKTTYIHRLAGYFFDGELIPYLKNALTENNNHNQFIVLHTFGNHYQYDARYSDDFKIYKPICKDTFLFAHGLCSKMENLINSYDNTIIYTDYFLSEVISSLKNENAIMIFVSDHAESLGENNMFYHASDYNKAPPEQTHIPVIMWASDKFLANDNNRKKFNFLKQREKSNITQKNIFHSIPHCLGFSKNIDLNFSLCRKDHE